MASLKKLGKIYGDKQFSYHRQIKKSSKKSSGKLARTRLKREVFENG